MGMAAQEIKTIKELNNELSKHRKLFNRAVGNKILPHINYHHYEIVKLIEEINDLDAQRDIMSIDGIFDFNVIALGNDFGKMIREHYLKAEDNAILTGQFHTITSPDGSHSDIHSSK